MDSDKVLVMDNGVVSEFGAPHELLQVEGGLFQSMVQSTGAHECERLKEIAKEAFASKRKSA